jgi:riboflavin kinase / FMN adenylyltransferase
VKGKELHGVTNVGFNPTFEGKELTIETFILDFSGDLYDEVVDLSFYRRIRDETKFASVDELKARIALDVETARSYFRERDGDQ